MYPPALFFYFHSFILHYRHSPFDHAVQHNNRRDALNNHDQGAEAEEEQDQGPLTKTLLVAPDDARAAVPVTRLRATALHTAVKVLFAFMVVSFCM